MEKFLKNSKKILESINNLKRPLNIVLGNETCDLDSSVCSICYAYYLKKKYPENDYLPVLNIFEREFDLRPELQELLSYVDINHSNLYTFRDQLDLVGLHKRSLLHLTLVDHHVMKVEDETELRGDVIEIIDHRPVVKHPGEKVKYLIEAVGSCASLIAECMLNDTGFKLTNDVAILLYGVIIVDTVALSEQAGRATAKDAEIVGRLKHLCSIQYNDQQLYQKLHQIKISATNFTTLDLLGKDLKKVVNPETNFSIALTVIMQKMQEIFRRANILDDIRQFTSQCRSSALIVIFMDVSQRGDVTRQLVIYSENDLLRKEIARYLLESREPNLELQLTDSGIDTSLVIAYHQINVKATRKAILPIINANIHSLEKL